MVSPNSLRFNAEVVFACGFSVLVGLMLPRCVRMTRAVEKRLTKEAPLRYAQNQEKGPFHQHDDGFACVRSSGTSY